MSAVRARQRILVLEDDDDVGSLLAFALEDAGYEPVVHRDAAEADVDTLRTAPPSVIILDMVMPRARMDGFTFLVELAEHRPALGIPVIILSGLADVIDKAVDQRLLEHLVIAGVFPKPFSIDAVLARVNELTRPSLS